MIFEWSISIIKQSFLKYEVSARRADVNDDCLSLHKVINKRVKLSKGIKLNETISNKSFPRTFSSRLVFQRELDSYAAWQNDHTLMLTRIKDNKDRRRFTAILESDESRVPRRYVSILPAVKFIRISRLGDPLSEQRRESFVTEAR